MADLLDFDFGFTAVDENELSPKNLRLGRITTLSNIEDWIIHSGTTYGVQEHRQRWQNYCGQITHSPSSDYFKISFQFPKRGLVTQCISALSVECKPLRFPCFRPVFYITRT